jgi:hypothetical protein
MPADSGYLDALRQMLIQQFMLHEVEYHDLQAGDAEAPGPRVPVAHGLIDIYKCLHQGEFGVGHTIDHPEGFKQRLYQELLRGDPSGPAREPAVESVSADGRMLRINLRAVRRLAPDDPSDMVEALVGVCVESARITQGSGVRFFETLDAFQRLNQAGKIVIAGHVFAFTTESVEMFLFEIKTLMDRIRQVPVLSHSETYRRLNRPSYRVAERSVLQASPLAILLEK